MHNLPASERKLVALTGNRSKAGKLAADPRGDVWGRCDGTTAFARQQS